MSRPKKVPLPGVKTWYGKQVMVTPEELAKLEGENEKIMDAVRLMFTPKDQLIPDEIARTLKRALVLMPDGVDQADAKARAFAWVVKRSRDEEMSG